LVYITTKTVPNTREARITDGFVFRMNFAIQATAIYQYCIHLIEFHITAQNVAVCEVRTECIVDAHIHHPEKLALWLLSVGLSRKSQMHSNAWRYWIVPNHLKGFWKGRGLLRYIVTFWVVSRSVFMTTLWKQKWLCYLEIYQRGWLCDINPGSFDRIGVGSCATL